MLLELMEPWETLGAGITDTGGLPTFRFGSVDDAHAGTVDHAHAGTVAGAEAEDEVEETVEERQARLVLERFDTWCQDTANKTRISPRADARDTGAHTELAGGDVGGVDVNALDLEYTGGCLSTMAGRDDNRGVAGHDGPVNCIIAFEDGTSPCLFIVPPF